MQKKIDRIGGQLEYSGWVQEIYEYDQLAENGIQNRLLTLSSKLRN
jgi:hypothetical protein